jgi:hypothetical protein
MRHAPVDNMRRLYAVFDSIPIDLFLVDLNFIDVNVPTFWVTGQHALHVFQEFSVGDDLFRGFSHDFFP